MSVEEVAAQLDVDAGPVGNALILIHDVVTEKATLNVVSPQVMGTMTDPL